MRITTKPACWKVKWFKDTFVWALLLMGCSGGGDPLVHLNSLPDQTQVPQLLRSPDGVPALACVEAIDGGHRFVYRLWTGTGWGESIAIGTDTAMLVNWADRPQLAFGPSGSAYAHWLTFDEPHGARMMIRDTATPSRCTPTRRSGASQPLTKGSSMPFGSKPMKPAESTGSACGGTGPVSG